MRMKEYDSLKTDENKVLLVEKIFFTENGIFKNWKKQKFDTERGLNGNFPLKCVFAAETQGCLKKLKIF